MKRILKASLLALALAAATGAHADTGFTINFDSLTAGANASFDPVAKAHGVSFASGQLMADLDADGYEILDPYNNFVSGFTHYEAIPGVVLTADIPANFNHGTTTSGSLALNALFDQTLIRFAAPVQMTGFAFTLDNSSYGDLFLAQVQYLDANGKTLRFSSDFTGGGTSAFSETFAATSVSAILLPSTSKLYDDIRISAVPEPSSALMLGAGLLTLLAASVASRRSKG